MPSNVNRTSLWNKDGTTLLGGNAGKNFVIGTPPTPSLRTPALTPYEQYLEDAKTDPAKQAQLDAINRNKPPTPITPGTPEEWAAFNAGGHFGFALESAG